MAKKTIESFLKATTEKVIAIKLKQSQYSPKTHWIVGVNNKFYSNLKGEFFVAITKSTNPKQRKILKMVLESGLKQFVRQYKRKELYETLDQRNINKLEYPLKSIEDVYSLN